MTPPTGLHPSTHDRLRLAIGVFAVALTALIAYLPALSAGFIWDDPDYVINNPTLRDRLGLWQIWTDPLSLPQWYPLVHTTFWIEYQIWGLWSPGYHAVNVLLHIGSCVLIRRLCVELGLGELTGWAAAALFAAHPVNVESVAWITERKNVLSLPLALAAVVTYLHWRGPARAGDQRASDQPANDRWAALRVYLAAVGLFVAAMLSKTVVAAVPAALLVIAWWQRGRIDRRDLLSTAPMFAIGIALGLTTAMIERHVVGAGGPLFDHSPAERVLIAGRAVWFYLATLAWPGGLVFIYPRWSPDAGSPGQWLFPLAAVAALLALYLLRRAIGRGAMAAGAIYVGTLLPALGFLNVYPHRYSFVADHFQYHASVAMFVLAAAGVVRLSRWMGAAPQPAAARALALTAMLSIPLAGVTHRTSRHYASAQTLWSWVESANPTTWVAPLNLGLIEAEAAGAAAPQEREARLSRARAWFELAYQRAPDVPDTARNIAVGLTREGRDGEAVDLLTRAIETYPDNIGMSSLYTLRGNALERLGRSEEALSDHRKAVALQPRNGVALSALVRMLIARDRGAEAIAPLERYTRAFPRDASAWRALAMLLEEAGQPQRAAAARLAADRWQAVERQR